VNHEVCAQIDRTLKCGGAKAVVDDEQSARTPRQTGERFDVEHFRKGIGRRFQVEQPGIRPQRRFPLGGIGSST